MNGKGDTPRRVNGRVYRKNFETINWKRTYQLTPELTGSRVQDFDVRLVNKNV